MLFAKKIIYKFNILRISRKIIELRKSKQWTISDLANATGMNRSNISRIENGHYAASIDVLSRIAHAFDCKSNYSGTF